MLKSVGRSSIRRSIPQRQCLENSPFPNTNKAFLKGFIAEMIADSHGQQVRGAIIYTFCVNNKLFSHAEKRGPLWCMRLWWEALREHSEREGESLMDLPASSPHSG